ncbi:helix-turn-helix transcriptional regulator [Hoeflea prorocentri]|uniref:Helix-turn-helix transcriptional regulator n=1 Tax=Hoeflea prorocentri TaxID=1922333 RepID=A0A9X3ZFY1_9HYPH|nr:helix-turn-helix transcriptional regulator [Hoeflea prorocentri]MCY6379347.1 helix-turn-helix transcriptional regulator [Hoeflea prorocentri]MDA5397148.1 helix-turn-helix transcriptional regulator [Hoeflea prorocentri]
MVTSEQIRGARAMLRWEQKQLSKASGVSIPTIKRMEAGSGPVRGTYENVLAIQTALEDAGVEFVDANGGGPGVRLRG